MGFAASYRWTLVVSRVWRLSWMQLAWTQVSRAARNVITTPTKSTDLRHPASASLQATITASWRNHMRAISMQLETTSD